MFDTLGYLKVIDFGLAKHIPFLPPGSSLKPPAPQKKKSIAEALGLSRKGVVVSERQQHVQKSYTVCGTQEYLSPECLTGRGHDKSIDLWALGCLLYELFNGRTPFKARHAEHIAGNICDAKRHLATLQWMGQGPPEAVHLVKGLLDPNPATRLGNGAKGWGAVTAHPFFASVPGAPPGRGEVGGARFLPAVDWDGMVSRAVAAPFTPAITDALDMSGFEDAPPPAPEAVSRQAHPRSPLTRGAPPAFRQDQLEGVPARRRCS